MVNRLFKREELRFKCLNGDDVITAKISDHHPVIHRGLLLWNILMPGRFTRKEEFNNGLGIIEKDDKSYMDRLGKVAEVIKEITQKNSHIKAIGLCEGPIKKTHTDEFFKSLPGFKNYKPNLEKFDHWGLIMLTRPDITVTEITCDLLQQLGIHHLLANRFQIWRLSQQGRDKYIALAHFPLECHMQLNIYRDLINRLLTQYANEDFSFCADFNFSPYLINHYRDRLFDCIPHHNSILLTKKHGQESVTVDGILLSAKIKQKIFRFQSQFFARIVDEYKLFKSYIDDFNIGQGAKIR